MAQGRDNSFTLNLTASSPNAKGRQKAATVIFTKRVGMDSLGNFPTGLHKADGSSEEETTEPIILALPEGTTEINATVIGDQSGSIASEKITVDSSGTSTLFMNVSTLPHEIAAHTEESPVDVALYTVQKSQGEEATLTKPSRNKSEAPTLNSGSEFQLLAVDQDDGTLTIITKIRKGYGGTGSIDITNREDLDFIVQKGKEGSPDNRIAVSMANDGSMSRLSLPSGSTPLTMATDLNTGTLFELQPLENRLVVKRQTDNGTLEKIQDIATGRGPSMVYRIPLSRHILVANSGDQTVSAFAMGADDRLTLVETLAVERPPLAITATSNGRFVYVSLQGGGISRFAVAEDGRLTLIDTMATEGSLISLGTSQDGEIISGLVGGSRVACSVGVSCKSIVEEGTRDMGITVPDSVVEAVIDFTIDDDEISDDILQGGKQQKPSNKARITIIKKGTGTGRVVSNPGGVDCGGDCEERWHAGKKITLTAIPDAGSVFGGWGRKGCPGTTTCKWRNWKSGDIGVTFNSIPPSPVPPPLPSAAHWYMTEFNSPGFGPVPGQVDVIDNTTGIWKSDRLIDRAIKDWQYLWIDRQSPWQSPCNAISMGLITVCNANYGGTLYGGALGTARVFYNNQSHIYQAVVELDDWYLVSGRKLYFSIDGLLYLHRKS